MFENIVVNMFFKWNFAAENRLLEFSFNSGFVVQVIFETSRLATIVNGVLRKTTKDMEMNGKSYDNIHLDMITIYYLRYSIFLTRIKCVLN